MQQIQINSVVELAIILHQDYGQIPYSEWVKMTKEQQNAVFAKWNQEKMTKGGGILKPFPSPHHSNMLDIEAYVDFDRIIDYAILKHKVDFVHSDVIRT
jgi:hypothetical protein